MQRAHKLNFERKLDEDICTVKEKGCTMKIARREGYSRMIKYTEGQESSAYNAVLKIESSASKESIRAGWECMDLFRPAQEYEMPMGVTRIMPIDNLITMNKTKRATDPTVLYSNNGLKYTIATEHERSTEDAYTAISYMEKPIKIGLYKNIAMFLSSRAIEMLECTTRNTYKMDTLHAIDMAVPKDAAYTFPVLRKIEQTPGTLQGTMNTLLDIVDMNAGKITTQMIRSNNSMGLCNKIASTWHPEQYICATSTRIAHIDTRTKESCVVWVHRLAPPTHRITRIESKRVKKIEQAGDAKIAVLISDTLTVLDIRYLNNPLCSKKVPIEYPQLAVGKHLAVYNRYGEFYYQSINNIDSCAFKKYNFDTTQHLLAFDWSNERQNEKFSKAAFLFDSSVRIVSSSGCVKEHTINTVADKSTESYEFNIDTAVGRMVRRANAYIRRGTTMLQRKRIYRRTQEQNDMPYIQKSIAGRYGYYTKETDRYTETMLKAIAHIVPLTGWPGTILPVQRDKRMDTVQKYNIVVPGQVQDTTVHTETRYDNEESEQENNDGDSV